MTQQCQLEPSGDPAVATVRDRTVPQDADMVTRQHVYEGEALRAVAEYSFLDFASPPTPAVLALLDVAYDHMESIRPGATPEDFAVYVFSLLREVCANTGEEEELKICAARYIVDNTPFLSADFAEFVPQARALIAQTDAAGHRPHVVDLSASEGEPLVLVPNMELLPVPETELPRPEPLPTPSEGTLSYRPRTNPSRRVSRGRRAATMNSSMRRAAKMRRMSRMARAAAIAAGLWLAYLVYAPNIH